MSKRASSSSSSSDARAKRARRGERVAAVFERGAFDFQELPAELQHGIVEFVASNDDAAEAALTHAHLRQTSRAHVAPANTMPALQRRPRRVPLVQAIRYALTRNDFALIERLCAPARASDYPWGVNEVIGHAVGLAGKPAMLLDSATSRRLLGYDMVSDLADTSKTANDVWIEMLCGLLERAGPAGDLTEFRARFLQFPRAFHTSYPDYRVLATAAEIGNIAALVFFAALPPIPDRIRQDQGDTPQWHIWRATKPAAAAGQIAVLEWFLARPQYHPATGFGTFFGECAKGAVEGNQRSVLEWLLGKNLGVPLPSGVYDIAAEHGHVDLMQWLLDTQHIPLPASASVDVWDYTPIAGLEWYAARNVPIDVSTAYRAAANRNATVLAWLREHGIYDA